MRAHAILSQTVTGPDTDTLRDGKPMNTASALASSFQKLFLQLQHPIMYQLPTLWLPASASEPFVSAHNFWLPLPTFSFHHWPVFVFFEKSKNIIFNFASSYQLLTTSGSGFQLRLLTFGSLSIPGHAQLSQPVTQCEEKCNFTRTIFDESVFLKFSSPHSEFFKLKIVLIYKKNT